MRRSTTVRAGLAAALILSLGIGGLAACSSGGGDEPTPSVTSTAGGAATASADDQAKLDAVTVEGDRGAAPTVTLPETPFTVGGTAVRVIADGDGAELAAGQLLSLHSTWVNGADGSSLGGTYDQGTAEAIVLDETQLPAELVDALVGAKIGIRVLLALPGQDGATVAVVDVAAAQDLPARAEGTAVEPQAGLPAVTLDDTGKPSLTPATGDAPTSLVAQRLIEGTGPEVTAGQTVVVKYTGWLWDGTQFDSSWDAGATFPVANIGQGQVIDGWNQGLVGHPVGSQVLLVVPPDLGYKDQENGSIPANSTLVFVVDILAAV